MIELNIWPRRSGKTTRLLDRYKAETEKTGRALLIAPNKMHYKDIGILYNTPVSAISDRIGGGVTPYNLFIDEYFNFSLKDRKELCSLHDRHYMNIIIYSTSNMIYNTKLIDLVKQAKANGVSESCFSKDTIDNYYYNFITDPKCKIYSQPFYKTSKDIFSLEVLNQWHN